MLQNVKKKSVLLTLPAFLLPAALQAQEKRLSPNIREYYPDVFFNIRQLLPKFGMSKIISGNACQSLASVKSYTAALAKLRRKKNHQRQLMPNFGKCKTTYGDICHTLAEERYSQEYLLRKKINMAPCGKPGYMKKTGKNVEGIHK